jgi:hypothetical protein
MHILDLNIGDYVKVLCRDRVGASTGTLEGTITRLWKNEDTKGCRNLTQAEVNSGWCFHPHDEIIQHVAHKVLDKPETINNGIIY